MYDILNPLTIRTMTIIDQMTYRELLAVRRGSGANTELLTGQTGEYFQQALDTKRRAGENVIQFESKV